MTAPQKVPITATVIHHQPVYVTVPDTPDPYPVNPRFPPDPAIYGQAEVFDCRELDQERKR